MHFKLINILFTFYYGVYMYQKNLYIFSKQNLKDLPKEYLIKDENNQKLVLKPFLHFPDMLLS